MRKRIVSTLLLWAGLLGILGVFGSQGAVWIIAAAAAATQYELYRMFEHMKLQPDKSLGILCGLLISLGGYYFGILFEGRPNIEAGTDLFVLGIILLTLSTLSSGQTNERLRNFIPTLIGLTFIPFMMHFFVRILLKCDIEGYARGTGLFLCIYIVAASKFTDVGALLVGKLIGKHKLAPVLSPAKTWEGAAGGVLTSAVVGFLVLQIDVLLGGRFHPESMTPWLAALLPVPIAFVTIASDLMESAFKRAADIKDSGNMVPGIGGAFDLTDSLILAGPCGYILFKLTIF